MYIIMYTVLWLWQAVPGAPIWSDGSWRVHRASSPQRTRGGDRIQGSGPSVCSSHFAAMSGAV